VIEHKGDNIAGGHFVAYVRKPDEGWKIYDDSQVNKMLEQSY